jgi:hypothetical protein
MREEVHLRGRREPKSVLEPQENTRGGRLLYECILMREVCTRGHEHKGCSWTSREHTSMRTIPQNTHRNIEKKGVVVYILRKNAHQVLLTLFVYTSNANPTLIEKGYSICIILYNGCWIGLNVGVRIFLLWPMKIVGFDDLNLLLNYLEWTKECEMCNNRVWYGLWEF